MKALIRKLVFPLFTLIILVSMTVGSSVIPVLAEPEPPVAPKDFAQSNAQLTRHTTTGKVSFLSVDAKTPISTGAVMKAADAKGFENSARAFLAEQGALFGLSDQAQELQVLRKSVLENGRQFVRFQQTYQGIPVLAGELNVQMDTNGNVITVNGEILPNLNISTEPVLSSEEAVDLARQLGADKLGVAVEVVSVSKPELAIYSPQLLESASGDPRLVWQITVTAQDLPAGYRIMLDAANGDEVMAFEDAWNALSISIYNDANTGTYTLGTLVCENETDCSSSEISDAQKAYTYLKDAYDYFSLHMARDSYDGYGSPLVAEVNFGTGFTSFWNGANFYFGSGYSQADDIVGHEFGHAVIDNTSGGLYPWYQSGAIAESLADMWGEFIDQTNGKGTDDSTVKWRIGEDAPGGYIRDMKTPTNKLHPDKMTSSYYLFTTADSGGIHTNSGVNNKAVYLLTDGGSFNGQTIAALGRDRVAAIYYQAQQNFILSGSDYADLADQLYQACQAQVNLSIPGSADKVSYANCLEVKKATLAVEMKTDNTTAPTPPGSPAAYCPAGTPAANFTKPVDITFEDDFENGAANWTINGTAWIYDGTVGDLGRNAKSGLHFMYGANYIPNANSTLKTSTSYLIPNSAYLHFAHSYSLEDGVDGGVVEYSENGTDWVDMSTLTTVNGYNGTISAAGDIPGFTGSSYGYTATRYDLSTLAGKNVQFRWRIITDANYDPNDTQDQGWWLDDVLVYTCLTPNNIEIEIGGTLRGSYFVPVNGRQTPRFWENGGYTGPGLQNGPVRVSSTNGDLFFTSERVHFTGIDSTKWTAFNEVMGYPTERLTTEYYFTWYDNKTMYTWVLIGNPSLTETAEVDVYIGGVLQGQYSIGPRQRVTPRYWVSGQPGVGDGLQAGPVRVVSTNGVKIFTSERTHFPTLPWTGFNEVMGFPVEELDTEYWFPWYDNDSMLTWVLVGNPSLTETAEVDIYIGDMTTPKGHYEIGPQGKVTPRYWANGGYTGPGLVAGPVRVVSTNEVDIFASERVHYPYSPWKDFNEVMGVPLNRISTNYVFTWYDNKTMIADIMVTNPTASQTAQVEINIAGEILDHFNLGPRQTVSKRYYENGATSGTGLQNGPVKVISTNNVSLITSERVQYKNPGATSYTGFNELMGYPLSDLSDEYWFTWYDNNTMVNWVLVGR